MDKLYSAIASIRVDAETMSANVYKSLELLAKGMLGIFIVMLLIFIVIYVLNRTTAKPEGKQQSMPAEKVVQTGFEEELLAVLLPVICEDLGADPEDICFTEIKEC